MKLSFSYQITQDILYQQTTNQIDDHEIGRQWLYGMFFLFLIINAHVYLLGSFSYFRYIGLREVLIVMLTFLPVLAYLIAITSKILISKQKKMISYAFCSDCLYFLKGFGYYKLDYLQIKSVKIQQTIDGLDQLVINTKKKNTYKLSIKLQEELVDHLVELVNYKKEY
jgi:hypothetical protein